MKKLAAMIMVLALMAFAVQGALADVVSYEGREVTLEIEPLVQDVEEEDYDEDDILIIQDIQDTVTVSRFMVLGRTGEGMCLVLADGQMIRATEASVAEALGGSLPESLPALDEMETVERGAGRESIALMQQALIDLGYLEGSADGSYGQMTRSAVAAFQEAVGMEPTGEADAATQVLLDVAIGNQEMIVKGGTADAELLENLDARCEADLSVFAEGYRIEYDDISGTGFISNGNQVSAQILGGADIDNCTFELSFGFAITDKGGVVTVRPQVRVDCTAVRRPMMESLTLKSGDARWSRSVSGLSNGISGSKSVESGIVEIKGDAAPLLAGVAEAGELKIRVTGKYQTYDLTVEEGQLAAIADVGRIAEELLA